MKEKTLKDVIEQTKHNVYLGKFWNRYIQEFQTWEENQEWEEKFESFCSRMCGMKGKNTSSKTARDPQSRINKSLRAWNCGSCSNW